MNKQQPRLAASVSFIAGQGKKPPGKELKEEQSSTTKHANTTSLLTPVNKKLKQSKQTMAGRYGLEYLL